jgi:hypothetical protein
MVRHGDQRYNLMMNQISGDFDCDLSCRHMHYDIDKSHLDCYDKDGFDLTKLEQIVYEQNDYKLHWILNRKLFARPWHIIDSVYPQLYIDHSILLMRCDFIDECYDKISLMAKTDKRALFILKTKKKWGIDIDINWIEDDEIYEIIHLEHDSYDYEDACVIKEKIESYFMLADIADMANKIKKNKDVWSQFNGLRQNDWKAKYFGFNISEDTVKSF